MKEKSKPFPKDILSQKQRQKQAEEFYKKGLAAQKTKNLADAVRYFVAACKANPSFRVPYMHLGVIYSQLGESPKALVAFHHAYELSSDATVCFNLGSEYFKQKEYDHCRDYLKKALRHDSRLLKAHLLMAYMYQQIKHFDRAAVYFQNVLKLDNSNRIAILGYVVALSEQKEYEVALYALEQYFSKQNAANTAKDVFAQELHAKLLLELGRVDEAYKNYEALIHTAPKFTNFTDYLKRLQEENKSQTQPFLNHIDDKISWRKKRLLSRLAKLKEEPQEKKPNLASTLPQEVHDMLDLSLLHLFKGEGNTALGYLRHLSRLSAKKKPIPHNIQEIPKEEK